MTRSLRTLGWTVGLSAASLALAGSEPLAAGPIASAIALRNADEGATPVHYRGRYYAWYAPPQYYYPPPTYYYGYYGPPTAYLPPVYGYDAPPVAYYRPPAYAYRPPVYGYYRVPPARYYAPPYYYVPRYRYEYDAAW